MMNHNRTVASRIRPLILPLGMLVALFGSAGRLDMPFVWIYIAIYAASTLIAQFIIDPGLRQERRNPGAGDKDRFSRRVLPPLLFAHWIIVGLDVGRFHWSETIPTVVRMAGVAGLTASFALLLWACKANPFFSRSIRIQDERGHYLVTAGPYQYVRHPGNVFSMLIHLFGALVLGSWWATIPIAGYIALLIKRTALEDRFLQQELEGYPEYLLKVPHRLIPGIW